jgi:hypothetical protein
MPHDDYRQITTAVAHQQLDAASPPAEGVRRQQPAPDERGTLVQQRNSGGAALLTRKVGRYLSPVIGVSLGQPVGDLATVRGGIEGRPWGVG